MYTWAFRMEAEQKGLQESYCLVFGLLLPELTHGVSSLVLLSKLSSLVFIKEAIFLTPPKSNCLFWRWLAGLLNSLWLCWPSYIYLLDSTCYPSTLWGSLSLSSLSLGCGSNIPWCHSVLRMVMRSGSALVSGWQFIVISVPERKENHGGGTSQALWECRSRVCYK